ncbi:MAG: carbonic anhydrase [Phycisphaerae bacterium]
MIANKCAKDTWTAPPLLTGVPPPTAVLLLAAVLLISGCAAPATLPGPGPAAGPLPAATSSSPAVTPQQALALLKQGNERFVRGTFAASLSEERRHALVAGQAPFAVIVCCSDSRVAPELVFDQSLGDVFVVRVAGNVVDSVVLGSVEYAAEHLHSPLIVVLGHENCGAVEAALKGGTPGGDIGAIVEKIAPSARAAQAEGLKGPAALARATDLNIAASRAAILASPIVARLLAQHKLLIVGAKYHLGSGKVEWVGQTAGN